MALGVGDVGVLLAVAGIGLLLIRKDDDTAFIGAGITAARPRGITAARPKGITAAKPKPKPQPKLVSRFNPKTTSRPIRGQQTKQGSQVQQQHKRLVQKAAAAARMKAIERTKIVAMQRVVSAALSRPGLSLNNRKFLTMTNVTLNSINKRISILVNPTPAAIQTIRVRAAIALRKYGVAITTPKTGIIQVGFGGSSKITMDVNNLTNSIASGGTISLNQIPNLVNTAPQTPPVKRTFTERYLAGDLSTSGDTPEGTAAKRLKSTVEALGPGKSPLPSIK